MLLTSLNQASSTVQGGGTEKVRIRPFKEPACIIIPEPTSIPPCIRHTHALWDFLSRTKKYYPKYPKYLKFF
jgi:hypothetical protein